MIRFYSNKMNLNYLIEDDLLQLLKNGMKKIADRKKISVNKAFNEFLREYKTQIEAYIHYQLTYPFDEPETRVP